MCDECSYVIFGTDFDVLKRLCAHLYRHADAAARDPSQYRRLQRKRRARDAANAILAERGGNL